MRSELPFFLLKNDAQTGPFTLSQLRSMWSHGAITADTLYWQEGDAEWLSISSMLDEIEQNPVRALVPASPPAATVMAPPPLPVSRRTCLFCAEPIAETAIKCRHCGETLDPRLRAAEEANKAAALMAAAPRYHPQNVQQSVVVQDLMPLRSFPHGLHGIVTFFTLGLWLPIWILHYLCRNRRYYY